MKKEKVSKKRGFWWTLYVVILCVLLIGTLAFIWGNSLIPETYSAEESGAVYGFIQPFLDEIFGAGKVTELIVRKIMHGAEFCFLGLILTLLIAAYGGYNVKSWAFILSEGIFVALIDETLQLFVGRGADLIDVWIDVAGVAVISLIAGLIGLIVRLCRKKKRAKLSE